MRRVSVLGVSGSGKSTTGRALAERLAVPFVELDALNHGPGWTEATDAELRARVRPIVELDAWVIDGSYRSKLGTLVAGRADTVVWLDLPVRVWLPRLARRTLLRIVRREELWNGNRERVRDLLERPNIFGWAWRRHFEHRRTLESWLATSSDARLVRLRTRGQVRTFLERAGAGAPASVPGTVTGGVTVPPQADPPQADLLQAESSAR